MPIRPNLFRFQRLPRGLRVPALAAAIRVAGPEERPLLVAELFALAVPEVPPQTPDRGWFAKVQWLVNEARRRRDRTPLLALSALAVNWGRLEPDERALAAVIGRGRWNAALLELRSSSANTPDVLLARLAADVADPQLAAPVADLLSSPDSKAASEAERALLLLACTASGIPIAWTQPPGENPARDSTQLLPIAPDLRVDFASLGAAVAAAASRFPAHRARGALLAALVLLDPAARHRGPLADWLNHDEPSHAALRGLLRSPRVPLGRLRAWELLADDRSSDAALERLGSAATRLEHELVLGRAHLFARPKRAARLARQRGRIGAASRPGLRSFALPDPRTIAKLTLSARRGLPRVVGALATSGGREAAACLLPLLADECPLTRRRVVEALPPAELADYCFDIEECIARGAALRRSIAGVTIGGRCAQGALRPEASRILDLLQRSPHASVRAIAAGDNQRADAFASESSRGRIAARRLLLEDRAAFEARIRQALGAADTETRLRAVMLVRRLGLHDRFLEQLGLLAKLAADADDHDQRVAATAAAAAAECAAAPARAIVAAALRSPRDRLRANAVEGIARRVRGAFDLAVRDGETFGRLVELKDDPHHRVRANALRGLLARGGAWLYEPDALAGLASMLGDSRAAHRLAAVWAAERVLSGGGRSRLGEKWVGYYSRLDDLARNDGEPRVRARASAAAARLAAEVRTGEIETGAAA